MTTPHTRLVAALFVAVGLLAGMPGRGYAVKDVYDKFPGPFIDPEKWSGASVEGNFSQPAEEVIRGVENGQLRLAIVSYGNSTSDSGVAVARQQLNIKQLGDQTTGSGFITSMMVTVTVLDAEAQDCPANPETALPAQGRAMIVGLLFHDGPGGGPTDRTGDVGFAFQLRNEATGPTPNPIIANLFQCTTADCLSTVLIGTAFTFPSQWSLNTPVVLRALWQKANHVVRFDVNPGAAGGQSHEIDYSGVVPTDTDLPKGGDFKLIRVQNSVENCSGARKRGVMDALFDKVVLKRQP